MNVRVHLLWKTLEPVMSDSGLALLPTTALEDCPSDLDVLFVGGSSRGTWPLMDDEEVLQFLCNRGARARYVTSVCTGSLLLGAAGLLRGYRASSYWPVRSLLNQLGAIETNQRVVIDRNRITGGGVTAGMDFGLHVAAELRGQLFAEVQQLMFEYAPEPPFQSGTPETAPPEVLARATQMYATQVAAAREATERAARRLG